MIGPRTRAPLGVKTTNAKARAFQTPAPIQATVRPEKTLKKASTVRRSVKSKIRVALPEPVEADLLSKEPESDVSDIEYCPPPQSSCRIHQRTSPTMTLFPIFEAITYALGTVRYMTFQETNTVFRFKSERKRKHMLRKCRRSKIKLGKR